jgi:hypothetical protein
MTYTINWAGRDYVIKESGLFDVLDAIERHVVLPDLLAMVGSGRVNYSYLARGLHAMLVHVGVKDVPDMLALRREMVSEGLQNIRAASDGRETATGTAMAAIGILMQMLMDGAPPELMGDADDAKKKASRSPKPASKSRSRNGG